MARRYRRAAGTPESGRAHRRPGRASVLVLVWLFGLERILGVWAEVVGRLLPGGLDAPPEVVEALALGVDIEVGAFVGGGVRLIRDVTHARAPTAGGRPPEPTILTERSSSATTQRKPPMSQSPSLDEFRTEVTEF